MSCGATGACGRGGGRVGGLGPSQHALSHFVARVAPVQDRTATVAGATRGRARGGGSAPRYMAADSMAALTLAHRIATANAHQAQQLKPVLPLGVDPGRRTPIEGRLLTSSIIRSEAHTKYSKEP